jgi:signal transduction histidine kinase
MKERARLIGADLRIRSEIGKGTTVELRIPLSQSR